MGKRLRRILVIVAVLVVAGGGAVVWAASGSSVDGYRTATAAPAMVTATFDTTGTIQPVTQATVAFPVSGQVASLPAQVGQQVTAGQTLAQLDTTSLATALANAQSTLASARARLASDQSGQASAASAPGGGGVMPAAYVTAAAPAPDLKSLQDAVISAQSVLDQDLRKASALLETEQQACQDVVPQPDRDAQAPSQDDVDACTQAIQDAQTAQNATSDDGKKLFDAENALSDALSKALATAEESPAPKPSQAPSPSRESAPKTSSGSGTRSSGSGTRSQPASAEQLAADQAAIDAANAQIAVAQQNLAAATLVSPIDGTVAQVGFTAGQPAGQQQIVVIGPGASQVTTAVSDTQAGQIKPGQRATVTPDGGGKPITGQVTSIGLLSSTTSSGTPGYPVTISLPSSAQQLFPGATASVSIITSTANAAVTVPTSAVHLAGANATVSVLVNGKPQVRRISVGVIGPSVTEVRSGLTAGEQVVLADLSQPLPTVTSGSRGAFGGGAGGVRSGGR